MSRSPSRRRRDAITVPAVALQRHGRSYLVEVATAEAAASREP